MGWKVQVVEDMMGPLLCGRELSKLRNAVLYSVSVTTSIGVAPLIVFLVITVNSLPSWVDKWSLAPECSNQATRMERLMCNLMKIVEKIVFPLFKLVISPVQLTTNFINQGTIYGLDCGAVAVGTLVLFAGALVSIAMYLRYRLSTLHFEYSLRPKAHLGDPKYDPLTSQGDEDLCICETPNDKEQSAGIDCNPGLASTKLGHLQAVFAMLSKFVTGKGCVKGSDETFNLRHVQGHVTIAAARVLARVNTWTFVYRCIATACAVSAGVITSQGIMTVKAQLTSELSSGTKAVTTALVSFAIAIVTLVAATICEAMRRRQRQEKLIGQRFSDISAKVNNCERDDNACRQSIRQAMGDSDMIFGQVAAAPTEARYSTKMLAAATAIASIIAIIVVAFKMGPVSTAKGIRRLQSRDMRNFSNGAGALARQLPRLAADAVKRGGGAMTAQGFAENLRIAQNQIGTNIPVAHVIGWAVALTMLSISINVTAWLEIAKTLDAM